MGGGGAKIELKCRMGGQTFVPYTWRGVSSYIEIQLHYFKTVTLNNA